MAVIGTFGSFTAARLGIYASQSALNVTGNNIANINTKGYCRQRLDLVSLNSAGSARYANSFNLDIGYGVLAESVSQLRDPFMDIRYRNEQSGVGAYQARVEGLDRLSDILDEVGKGEGEFGLIEAQFNDLMQQLQIYSRNANDDVSDTNVRSSAESLVTLFNAYSKALDKAESTLTDKLKDEVKSVNTMLEEIRDLTVQIREANIYGDSALELRDARNVLIDDLSSHMKIDVRYSMEEIDEYKEVEKLTITIADSGYPPIKLIDGIYGAQLTMNETTAMRNPDYDPELPEGNQYIRWDSTKGNIQYTHNKREALRSDDGKIVTNDDDGEALLQTIFKDAAFTLDHKYDLTVKGAGQYLKADKTTTDAANEAEQVTNAVTGDRNNRLWMQVQPLKDERGRYMRDQHDREIKEVIELGDNTLYGSLQTNRELLTEEGEFASEEDISFDKDANIKRGLPYYRHSLDALARKFAEIMNEANTDATRDADGKVTNMDKVFVGYETEIGADGIERYKMDAACPLLDWRNTADAQISDIRDRLEKAGFSGDYLLRTDLKELPSELQAEIKALQTQQLVDKDFGVKKMGGGVLFSNRGDGDDWENITAGNISIAKSWSTGDVRILNSKKVDGLDHSTDSDNIRHMISLMEEKRDFLPGDVVPDADQADQKYFNGTFQDMLNNFNHLLATDQQNSTIQYNSYTTRALSLDNQRQSVSGVDLNEEATSMMQYQKSYAAACQLMTTLDSMLDKLINGTIR